MGPPPTRWAPTSYKWSYNPYKWPYNWVTGVITPISGLITILITGRGAHLPGVANESLKLTSPNLNQWIFLKGSNVKGGIFVVYTLPKTNRFAPKNGWFPIGISLSKGLFSGANC